MECRYYQNPSSGVATRLNPKWLNSGKEGKTGYTIELYIVARMSDGLSIDSLPKRNQTLQTRYQTLKDIKQGIYAWVMSDGETLAILPANTVTKFHRP